MKEGFILAALVYFIWGSISLLREHGWPFEAVQWIILAMLIVMSVCVVYYSKIIIKRHREELEAEKENSESQESSDTESDAEPEEGTEEPDSAEEETQEETSSSIYDE